MKILALTICLLIGLTDSAISKENLTVATAANVQFTMKKLSQEFKKKYGIVINSVVASSGKLTTQIENGAPFDVFLSADTKFPDKLYKDNFAVTKPKVYAYGSLVLCSDKNIDLSPDLKFLNNTNIEKIAVANPKNAPYGEQTVKALKYYKVFENIRDKIIYGESISQVNNYILTNSVKVAFTSKSSVLAPEMKNKIKWVEINKDAYRPIAQAVVILKYGKQNNSDISKKFYNFLFSKKAQNIFIKDGYIIK